MSSSLRAPRISVLELKKNPTTGEWIKDAAGNFVRDEVQGDGYLVQRYRPRIEGLFARIERVDCKQGG